MTEYKVNSLITEYIQWVENDREKSQNTVKNYLSDLIIFDKYINEHYPNLQLTEVTRQQVREFSLYMKNTMEWSNNTRRRRIVSLRNFYEYLYQEHYIKESPTDRVELPPVLERNPVYLTEKQAIKLVDMTESQNKSCKSRDRLILMLFLTTGLRAEELTNIKLNHITENTLTVIGKGDKEREIGLNDDVLEALKDYLTVRYNVSDYLFISNRSQHMSKRTIQYTVDKYIELAGLDITKFSTHKLRHSAAVLMHKGGMDIRTIQGVLGHSTVQTTEIYTHLDSEQMKQAANVTQGLFSKKTS